MAGRKAIAPRAVATMSIPPTGDSKADYALKFVEQSVQALQAERGRAVVAYDLIVGTNRVPHSLGRDARGYTITPSVADATFAHAIDLTNPRPDREIWISVVGVAQPRAQIEVF